MTRFVFALALLIASTTGTTAHAQEEGPTPTQALVAFESKSPVAPTASSVSLKINNRATQRPPPLHPRPPRRNRRLRWLHAERPHHPCLRPRLHRRPRSRCRRRPHLPRHCGSRRQPLLLPAGLRQELARQLGAPPGPD